MINLLKLQISSVIAVKKEVGLVLIMSIIMVFINPAMISFSSAMFIMGMCYTPIVYEEKSRNSFLVHSLPIKPKQYVLSKFIYCGIVTALGILLSIVEYFVMGNLNMVEGEMLNSVILGVVIIGLVMTAVVIPTAMIVGFEKGRYILVFLVVIPICFSQGIMDFISKIRINDMTMTVLGILIGITVVLTSYFITSNMYSKKEVV